MVRYLLPRILLPLMLLLGVEMAFRFGVWEPLAARDSHSGTSIRAKQGLLAHTGQIDFITLGSSRAEYGLDHQLIHEHARERGIAHLNVSQPGSHWLSITTISAWVRKHHPELKGGVIGLSYLDFQYPFNGSYELAIAQPFRPLFQQPELYRYQFDPNKKDTYGTWSALLAYRQDIRSYLEHPGRRHKTNAWFTENKPWRFDENPETGRDVCAMPWTSIEQCLASHPADDAQTQFVNSCKAFAPGGARADWSNLGADETLQADRAQAQNVIRQAIRDLDWPTPPVIVLLPTTHHWRDEISPIGAHEWALRILSPLVERGEIVLIDRSGFFDEQGKTRCDVFIDLHHQNGKGARELTEQLLPDLDRNLYSRP